jgi:hypothetical protein
MTTDDLQQQIAFMHAQDEQGRIAGYGLTLRATPHSARFGTQTLYGLLHSVADDFAVHRQVFAEFGGLA